MTLLDKINLRWSDKAIKDYYNKCNGGSIQHQGRSTK